MRQPCAKLVVEPPGSLLEIPNVNFPWGAYSNANGVRDVKHIAHDLMALFKQHVEIEAEYTVWYVKWTLIPRWDKNLQPLFAW